MVKSEIDTPDCDWCGAIGKGRFDTRVYFSTRQGAGPVRGWEHVNNPLCTSCSIAVESAIEKTLEMVADAQSKSSFGGKIEIRQSYCNAEYDEHPKAKEAGS